MKTSEYPKNYSSNILSITEKDLLVSMPIFLKALNFKKLKKFCFQNQGQVTHVLISKVSLLGNFKYSNLITIVKKEKLAE